MALQLEDYLPALGEPLASGDGRPLQLPIELIDEDPAQPRLEFDSDALAELAATIVMTIFTGNANPALAEAIATRLRMELGHGSGLSHQRRPSDAASRWLLADIATH